MIAKQSVLVTGSSSGFGFLIAGTLLKNGHTVFASMRGPEDKNAASAAQLIKIAAEAEGRLHLSELDVTNAQSVNLAVAEALRREHRLDVVVNNAGIGVGGFAETITDEQFQMQFDVNVFGVQRVIRAVLPTMRKQARGLIINISSIMGRFIIPFAATYTASKYALEGLTESYRYELSGTGVDVVLVEPGGFGTNFRANMVYGTDTQRLESYGPLAQLPDKMWAEFANRLQAEEAPDPQLVADAVLKLIETPAGSRPLRTVVDPLTGGEAASAMNRASDTVQRQVLEFMGMQELLTVKTAS